MTTETTLDPAIEKKIDEAIAAKFAALLEQNVVALTAAKAAAKPERLRRRLALVASKGTLDMAYPPLILATTAAALGWEVGIFFTFYGLDIINRKRNKHLQVAPLANPAMPVPVPNIIGAIPGMTAMATKMMKGWMNTARMPTIDDLIQIAKESGVQMVACTTTMGVMKVNKEDIIEGPILGGAAAFLDFAADAEVNLFI